MRLFQISNNVVLYFFLKFSKIKKERKKTANCMLPPFVFVIQTIKFLFASLIQTNFCPFFYRERKITSNFSLKAQTVLIWRFTRAV